MSDPDDPDDDGRGAQGLQRLAAALQVVLLSLQVWITLSHIFLVTLTPGVGSHPGPRRYLGSSTTSRTACFRYTQTRMTQF
jgi:hypothetical protein